MPKPPISNTAYASPAHQVAQPATSRHQWSNVIGKLICGFLGLALVALCFLNRVAIEDYIKGLRYQPTTAMAEIQSSLGLTSTGERIFRASYPTLESRDEFNRDCESFDAEVSVLGCYASHKIYVYNIEEPELAGIRESTTAHELLHAVWERLSGIDKNRLVPLLEDVYRTNESSLKDTLDGYAESERLDELYVRAATQIAALPSELETHYATYFTDRAQLVKFYTSYITPFEELSRNIDTLSDELELLRTDIDTRTATYESRSDAFNRAVDEFNRCAETAGCFASDYAFTSRRRELVAEQGALDSLYDELNSLIDSYNTKVDEYNSNVLRSNDLQNVINSNAERKENL